MNKLKIVFFGSPYYSVPLLEKTIELGHEVLLVVSQGTTKTRRGKIIKTSVHQYCEEKNISNIIISANIEYDLSMMSDEEKKEYFELYNLEESGIDRVAKHGYDILNLGTFFTSGPTETRAWTIKKNSLAPEAAGKIHTDFQKGFIRAEVIAFNDYISLKGSVNAKNEGKMRLEGKEYQVAEGDIVVFRYNV